MDQQLVSAAEAQLMRIRDVTSVAIEYSESGIDTVHVVALESRRPKQIVRDVVSSLRASLNLVVDHKKVSVVCEGRDPGAPAHQGAAPTSRRPSIVSIMIRDRGADVESEVVLAAAGREVMGRASGGAAMGRRASVTALATLRALERFLAPGPRFELLDVRDVELAGHPALAVAVGLSESGSSAFVGCVWTEGDRHRAAVTAVLDATNRLLGRLPRRAAEDVRVSAGLGDVARDNGR